MEGAVGRRQGGLGGHLEGQQAGHLRQQAWLHAIWRAGVQSRSTAALSILTSEPVVPVNLSHLALAGGGAEPAGLCTR